jgi:hypothetical protein
MFARCANETVGDILKYGAPEKHRFLAETSAYHLATTFQ